MTEIKDKEIMNVEGGGLSVWAILGIGATVVFLIGVFDGYTRPLACKS